MDSLTQALLGGAVGLAVAGRHHPRRALIYGAIAGTLPDLDVIIDYSSAIDDFTRHRGWTHSWVVHTLLAPLAGWLMSILDQRFSKITWMLLVWLAWITHSGLDALTVYGTQLFWPLSAPPVMGGSVFIIDPLYTLPLLVLCILTVWRPKPGSARNAGAALLISTAYLGWGLGAQLSMEHRVKETLARQNITIEKFTVIAAPFTTFLWRVVAIGEQSYLQAYASVFDAKPKIHFETFDRGREFAATLENNTDFQRLQWFSHGFNAVEKKGNAMIVKDLRMGSEPVYIFRFALMEFQNSDWTDITPYLLEQQPAPPGFFQWLWQRIWDRDYDVSMRAMVEASKNNHAPNECGETQTDEYRC